MTGRYVGAALVVLVPVLLFLLGLAYYARRAFCAACAGG